MLKLILSISSLFGKEPLSVQREMLNRLNHKRPGLDYSNYELLEIYEHANDVIKNRRIKPIRFTSLSFLVRHPKTALNLLNGKKLPIAEFEKFRKLVESKPH